MPGYILDESQEINHSSKLLFKGFDQHSLMKSILKSIHNLAVNTLQSHTTLLVKQPMRLTSNQEMLPTDCKC